MRNIKAIDPRYYQIGALTAILGYGVFAIDLDFSLIRTLATVIACLATQWFASTRVESIRFDPLSALITSLSLTLLLRTDTIMLAIMAGVIAIGSKFLIRVKGKHLFNPANFALVSLMLLTDRVWVSSGQWGSVLLIAIVLAAIGMLVLNRVRAFATSLAFVATFALCLLGRAWFLGDPWAIPLHQMQNGALLIFTFFMISDPRTTPDRLPARVVFGASVAVLAFVIEFAFYTSAGPIWALAISMPMVPLLNAIWSGKNFQWRDCAIPESKKTIQNKGVHHAH